MSEIRHSDCTLAARWASTALRTGDAAIIPSINLLRNGLWYYFEYSNISNPGDAELMRWMVYRDMAGKNEVSLSMAKYAAEFCKEEGFPLLGWQDSSDIAGVGVSGMCFASDQLFADTCRCW